MSKERVHAAIELLSTADECEEFARREQRRVPELAAQARRKAVELRAAIHGGRSAVEVELLQALCAYELARSEQRGRRTPASRTWPMVKKYGIIGTAERVVARPKETSGYTALVALGMRHFAFEAVILRHPSAFSKDAVARAKERLSESEGP
jgi:hypothetical protein